MLFQHQGKVSPHRLYGRVVWEHTTHQTPNSRLMLKKDWRFFTNPVWSGETTVGTTLSRRFTKTFAKILASAFRSDTGRYELQFRRFLSLLSSKEMIAWRIETGSDKLTEDSLKTDNNKGDSGSENFLKNSFGKPSGPGDLPLCMSLIAKTISVTEISFSNSSARSGLTEGTFIPSKKVSKSDWIEDESGEYSDW